MTNALTILGPGLAADVPMPAVLEAAGPEAIAATLEFFGSTIENANTRAAYMRAAGAFMAFLQEIGVALTATEPNHISLYIATLKAKGRAEATRKQHLAALREWFAYLTVKRIVATNPAQPVKGPKLSVTRGKTPILDAEEAGELLRSIPTATLAGLRDRALIGLMVFTFARVSAAIGLDRGDVYREQRRLFVRLAEKGGKRHAMPCHHTLEGYLAEYLEAAGLEDAKVPLFQSIDHRTGRLTGRRLDRSDAWAMVRRRARAAGIATPVCNHTFRGTGITAYLSNGGTLEKARQMAAHASTRTTQLYDRREDRVTLDEIVKINIRG